MKGIDNRKQGSLLYGLGLTVAYKKVTVPSVRVNYLEVVKAISEFGEVLGEDPPAGVDAGQAILVAREVLLLLCQLLPLQERCLVPAVQQHLRGSNP